MGDEYGSVIDKPKSGGLYDYKKIINNITKLIPTYEIGDIIECIDGEFGINPFDLKLLKEFIISNNITNVLEFGAGTSTKLLDTLNINRKSYALNSVTHSVTFHKINLYDDYSLVEKYITDNPTIDMVIIDCEHTGKMGALLNEKFLKLLNHSRPIFIHDWFDYGKKTYTEQVYYHNNILDKYVVSYMTDLISPFFDMEKNHRVPRCSTILTPILK